MATKRMLVDAIHPEETRIVVTNGNRLEEFDFESATRRQLRGNIYLAKVTRVEPSLQAAFIEYGGNRHGFLAFSEIHPDYYQIPVADREALLRDEEADEAHHEAEADAAADASVSESLPEGVQDADPEADPQSTETDDGEHDDGHIEQAPASSEPIESIGGGDAMEEMPQPQRRRVQKYKIQEVIKRRQVMLVQVVKEERGNKGAALTTYLSLAGRYSVLMPNTARGGGISRKITNAADRKRLKEITNDLEVPQGMGIILRTAGASRTKAEVKRDFEYLMRLWENVRSLTLKSQAPCLVYEEGSLIKRTIRDLYSKDIDELWVAGDKAHAEAKDFMRMIMPSHAKNVQLYKEDQPLFSKFNIEPQLDQMFSPQVTLPSGGYIVINPTEALVSIDVNSGRSTKEHNIEDTALQTNLEASEEISRQLRLRDLAGLIVIDYIDMIENRSNRAVERKLKDCLKNDRARIQVGRISHFGLMEMSRQRIRFGVVESSTHKCPLCEGTGLVRSVESVALMVMRHVEDAVLRRPGQSINVRVPVDVALYILNSKRETLTALEMKYQLSITIAADGKLTGNQFAVEKGEMRVHQFVAHPTSEHVRVDSASIGDDSAEDEVEDEEEEDELEEAAAPAGGEPSGDRSEPRGRRRRRRRGGEDRPSQPQQQRPVQSVAGEAPASEDTEDDEEDGEASAVPSGPRVEGEEPRKRRRRGRRGGRRNRRGNEFGENGELLPQPADNGFVDTGSPAVELTEATATPVPATMDHAEVPIEAEATVAVEASVESEVPVEPAVAEKPKRARRAKKDDTAEAAPVAEGEAKPKRTRARKPKADVAEPEPALALETPTETVAEAAPAPEPVPAPAPVVPEPAAAETVAEESAESRRPRKELPADGVIVTSSTPTPANEDGKPKKAGWWQRGFFGN